MKDERKERLRRAAYDGADAYRSGWWPECTLREWKKSRESLLAELRRRGPGFSEGEYGDALNQGFTESR